MQHPQWMELLEELRQQWWYREQIRHVEVQPSRAAIYDTPTSPIHPRVVEALRAIGIERLYRHQVQAIDEINSAKHTLIVTGSASGKTLCYNIPVLSKLLCEPDATAFYIFPTKALAQDQLRKLRELKLGELASANTYDGDTPNELRRKIRERCNLIFTNPDMLHTAILPNHHHWRRFLSKLRFVVLDEVHVYRGVFGMHVASIIRRLRRLCEIYGSSPTFICASATVGNPHELALNLLGVECKVISDDSAPFPGRTFVLWEPPLLPDGIRVSTMTESMRLLAFLIVRGIRTITFVQSRAAAEMLLRYVREELEKINPKLCDKVTSYRAGYLPEERRMIERKLFNGELFGVIATTALELGIDIGHLDAAILVGYPGSIASTMQQAARAGRTNEGLVILIATSNPVDQYIVSHHEYLFGRSVENAILNASNQYILAGHLLCAAFEQPITVADVENYFGKGCLKLLDLLSQDPGMLRRVERDGKSFYCWFLPKRPHDEISVRAIRGKEYEIRDVSRHGVLIGTVDEVRAFATAHEGAIYFHAGESYRVLHLDVDGHIALVEPFNGDEYTVPLMRAEVSIIKPLSEWCGRFSRAWFGEVKVAQSVVAYKRLRLRTNEVIGIKSINLPNVEYETEAVWLVPDEVVISWVQLRGFDLMGSLHAAEHAMVALMPLIAMCDERDIGGVSAFIHGQTNSSTIFIYDGYPGGAGFSKAAFERLEELISRTAEMIEGCACQAGCPTCIQSPYCGDNNHPLDKYGGAALLRWMVGARAKGEMKVDDPPMWQRGGSKKHLGR